MTDLVLSCNLIATSLHLWVLNGDSDLGLCENVCDAALKRGELLSIVSKLSHSSHSKYHDETTATNRYPNTFLIVLHCNQHRDNCQVSSKIEHL